MAMEVGLSGSLKFYHYVDNKGYRLLNSVEDLASIKFFIPESREVIMCIVSKEPEESEQSEVLDRYKVIGTDETNISDNNDGNINGAFIDVGNNDGANMDEGNNDGANIDEGNIYGPEGGRDLESDEET